MNQDPVIRLEFHQHSQRRVHMLSQPVLEPLSVMKRLITWLGPSCGDDKQKAANAALAAGVAQLVEAAALQVVPVGVQIPSPALQLYHEFHMLLKTADSIQRGCFHSPSGWITSSYSVFFMVEMATRLFCCKTTATRTEGKRQEFPSSRDAGWRG